MSERRDEPRPIGESLDRLTRSLGGPGAATLSAVFARWDDIVGAQIAAHARPLTLADGTLVIAVDEPIWRTQLAYLEVELLSRLDDVVGVGVVTAVQLRVRGPGGR